MKWDPALPDVFMMVVAINVPTLFFLRQRRLTDLFAGVKRHSNIRIWDRHR